MSPTAFGAAIWRGAEIVVAVRAVAALVAAAVAEETAGPEDGVEGEEEGGEPVGDDDEAMVGGDRAREGAEIEVRVVDGVGLEDEAEEFFGMDGIAGHAAVPDGVGGEAVGLPVEGAAA